MYSGSGFSDWEIGDVDVFIHDGVYHLFHLIIPNHDYIAHAISKDGISWKRTKNAIFVGDPGEWDDDMLWTMHVSKYEDGFRMFYTGLQRKDKGMGQRVGMAVSKDLMKWEKVDAYNFPLSSSGPYYEDRRNNPRRWISFRDPFFYKFENRSYLLVCSRSSFGPVSRRGNVALAELIDNEFKLQEPLLYPMVYDDVECPCVFQLKGKSYLIGSIREDVKVRYWFSDKFRGEYQNFRSDVILPQGNYAARVTRDGDHLLIYNFFFIGGSVNELRVLPPPKQIDCDENGKLLLKSFHRWDTMITYKLAQDKLPPFKSLLGNPTSHFESNEEKISFGSRSGYEIYVFEKTSGCFIWEGTLSVVGMGKFGLVSDIDPEGSGYFYSFDVSNGIVQVRAWGFNENNNHHNFVFNNIQSNIFKTKVPNELDFRLIRYGNYIELSINGEVKLTLIDYTYSHSGLGLYSASSDIELKNSRYLALSDAADEYASQEDGEAS